ncbi:hypothetical protein M2428_003977 [Arthrobacter sp. ES3-54]|nr:hypothetical protein [Arthrobacter sp. ES3-54]
MPFDPSIPSTREENCSADDGGTSRRRPWEALAGYGSRGGHHLSR